VLRHTPTALLCALVLWAGPARAYRVNEHVEVWGYFQSWVTLHEEMNFAPDPRPDQFPSGDEGADSTTGFSLNRARIGTRLSVLEGMLGVDFHLKLEDGVEVLDLLLRVTPVQGLTLMLGQFRIPGAYENQIPNSELDFILRTDTSVALVDYSLSRTTYTSSLFYGNRAFLRDFGLGLQGDLGVIGVPLRGFLMVGNGLGANLFIGGDTKQQFVVTNKGQFFYGVRLEVDAAADVLTLGAHFNYNKHDDVVFKSKRAVYDLHRISYSADATLRAPGTGLRMVWMYGAGSILDDFDDNGKTDFIYSGREGRLIWRLNPLLRLLGADTDVLERHLLELGFRWERYSTESDESGLLVRRDNWTVGLSYRWQPYIRMQFNVILHRVDEPYPPDLDYDVYLLCVQFAG